MLVVIVSIVAITVLIFFILLVLYASCHCLYYSYNCPHLLHLTCPLNKHIRQVNKQSLDAFIKDLDKQSWENSLISNYVNTAYNSFLDLFIEQYDKKIPLKILKDNKNIKTSKPWFTNGLRNACIKRKRLYKDYIKNRTLDAQVKYKSYRNKLTSILRKSEKQYYNQFLIEQKGNVKSIWKILNTIIRKPKNSHNYPDAICRQGQLYN